MEVKTLEEFFNSFSMPVVVFDKDAKIVFKNSFTDTLFSLSENDDDNYLFEVLQISEKRAGYDSWEKIIEEVLKKGNVKLTLTEKTPLKRIFEVSFCKSKFRSRNYVVANFSLKKEIETSASYTDKYKLNFLLEKMVFGIIIVNFNNRIKFVNKTIEKITKFNFDEIIGKKPEDFIHPDDRETITENIRYQIKNHIPKLERFFFRLLTKDGRFEWVFMSTVLGKWDCENSIIVFVRRYEEKLDEIVDPRTTAESKKYRTIKTLFDNLNVPMVITHASEIIYANNSFINLSGASGFSELNKLEIKNIIHPEDYEKYFRDSEPIGEYKIKIKNLKGKELWVKVSSQKVFWKEKGDVLFVLNEITEDVLRENKYREENFIFNTLINSSKEDLIIIKDGEGKWLIANNAYIELLHLQGVNYKGKTNKELALYSPFYTEYFDKWEKSDEECWAEGKGMRYETEIPTPHGESKYYDMLKSPIFNDDGTRRVLIVIGRDITEKFHAEKDLATNKKKYESLISNMQEAIVVTKNGNIEFCNNAFSKLTGYEKDELLNRSIITVIAPEDRTRIITSRGGKISLVVFSEPYEFMLLKKDGKKIWVKNKSVEIEWENEEKALLNLMYDSTEEKKALEEIKKLSVAIEQIQQSFIVLNANYEIEYVNPYFISEFKFEKDDIIGQCPSQLIADEMSREIFLKNVQDLEEGEVWQGELMLKKKTGEAFWGYAVVSPVTNSRGIKTNIVMVLIDIEELKKVEHELIEAKEKAFKNAELKSFFLAQMSHEIRTPVNAILSLTGLLKSELMMEEKLDDDYVDIFKSIENSGRRIFRTVDLLLNMSELKVGSYEPKWREVDIDKTINSVIREYKPIANEKGLQLHYFKRTSNTVLKKQDEYSIYQIFMQIMDNAVKYTEQGEVSVTLERTPEEEIWVHFKDTGIGISHDYLPKLFTEFSQEVSGYTRPFDGNGLGLALAMEFSKIIGAKIEVESEKGKGSVFTVILTDRDSRQSE